MMTIHCGLDVRLKVLIQIDSREHAKAIAKIKSAFDKANIKYVVSKLYVGDYMSYDNPRLVVDRKQNLSEICYNIASVKTQRERFIRELERAQDAGITVIVLVEHGNGIACIEDVCSWINPRRMKSKTAATGKYLAKCMHELEEKYDIKFEFCSKEDTGSKIIDILQKGE